MSARPAALIGLLVLSLAVGYVVLKPMPRAVESASRPLPAAIVVPQGTRACQRVNVPPGSGAVELTVSTAGKPGGRLGVVVRKGGREVARGAYPGGYSDTPVRVPLGGLARGVPDAEVCVANPRGPELGLLAAGVTRRTTTLGRAGDPGGESGPPARVLGAGAPSDQAPERMRMEWQFGDERSHASYAGTIAERAGLVKAPFLGSGLMWIALALTCMATLGAVALVVREGGRR